MNGGFSQRIDVVVSPLLRRMQFWICLHIACYARWGLPGLEWAAWAGAGSVLFAILVNAVLEVKREMNLTNRAMDHARQCAESRRSDP